jgi:hypothetical protein
MWFSYNNRADDKWIELETGHAWTEMEVASAGPFEGKRVRLQNGKLFYRPFRHGGR